MIIPRFWSEAQRQARLPEGERFLVRRFGWSATSQEDADTHARQRLEDALAVAESGGKKALGSFTRLERKAAYGGSDGLPIREEIVREALDGDVVLTRNSYGALCLNTPVAMFVDVDAPASMAFGKGCVGSCLLWPVAFGLALWWRWPSVWAALFLATAAAWVFGWLRTQVVRRQEAKDPRFTDLLEWTVDQTRTWCHERPEWRVATYETPAGVRLLPLHATFDPASEVTDAFMSHVGADPLYARMCRLQKCFRARVTPKPWRTRFTRAYVGGGVWPVTDPVKLSRRQAWIAEYELVLPEYAACRFVRTLGLGAPDERVERIQALHDDLSNATTRLPLA